MRGRNCLILWCSDFPIFYRPLQNSRRKKGRTKHFACWGNINIRGYRTRLVFRAMCARNFCTWHNWLRERHILCYETTIAGVHKSRSPGHRGDQGLCGGPRYLWAFSTELASYDPPRAWNFEVASRFLEILCVVLYGSGF